VYITDPDARADVIDRIFKRTRTLQGNLHHSTPIIHFDPAENNFTSMTSERLGKADALLKEASRRLEKYRHAIGSANYVMAQGLVEL
jgi:hypothetical protein